MKTQFVTRLLACKYFNFRVVVTHTGRDARVSVVGVSDQIRQKAACTDEELG